MTSKELVRKYVRFEGAARLPYDLPGDYGSDFATCDLSPIPDPFFNSDMNIKEWADEWGCVWRRLGNTMLGEVKNQVLVRYADLDKLRVPDVEMDARWENVEKRLAENPDKYSVCNGISLWTRVNCLRGMEDSLTDAYEYPDGLRELISIFVGMNRKISKRFAALGGDCLMLADDWGLQNTMQLNPYKWREIWKPMYRQVFEDAHDAGLQVILHSCGHIVAILDDLIEIGLDIIHMDQQENMGLELLGRRFGGRVTFFSPVDIQKTMCAGTDDEIRQYCRDMVKYLYKNGGGFIPRWYADPKGAGHSKEALDVMCKEFLRLSTQSDTN